MKRLEDWHRKFDRRAAVQRFKAVRCTVMRDLSTALAAGADLATSLNESAKRCENAQEKRFYTDVATRISSGRTLVQAMAPWFPPGERMLLDAFLHTARTNESIGTAFQKIVQVIEPFDLLHKAARKFAVVAVLITVAALCAIAFTMTALVQLANVLPHDQWPAAIRAAYDFAQWMARYGWALLPLLLATPFAVHWLLMNWQGPLRRTWDQRGPGFAIYRQTQGAFTMISLGAYASAGRGIGESCRALAPIATPWLRWYLNAIIGRSARKGAEIVDVGLFDWRIMVRLTCLTSGQALPAALATVGLQASNTIASEVIDRLRRAQLGVVASLSVVLLSCIVTVATLYFTLLYSLKTLH